MHTLKNILVALDFSPCSVGALRQALRIATWSGAKVQVLHAVRLPVSIPLPEGFIPVEIPSPHERIRHAEARWKDCSAKLATELASADALQAAEFRVSVGPAKAEILNAVDEARPDLLVMGSIGATDVKEGIGTVAAACLRGAETNVLLVRESGSRIFKAVLACIDFSEASREVLEQAVRVAAQDGAALHVVHVYDDPWHGMPRADLVEKLMPDFDDRMAQSVVERLREFCKPMERELNALKVQLHGLQHNEHWEGQGAGIVEFAHDHGIDLAVLGVRSGWSVRDFFMGSTAERVCRDAKCSILTVRPRAGGKPR